MKHPFFSLDDRAAVERLSRLWSLLMFAIHSSIRFLSSHYVTTFDPVAHTALLSRLEADDVDLIAVKRLVDASCEDTLRVKTLIMDVEQR